MTSRIKKMVIAQARPGVLALGGFVLLGLAVGGITLAEEAATQPAEQGAATRPAFSRAVKRALESPAPTDEEWGSVVAFMSQYSPNRMKAIEEQGNSPRLVGLRKLIWSHYKDLTAFKDRGDQELYDLKLKQVQADDEVWGLQRKLRESSESDRAVVRHQLRQKMTETIQLGLKEREIRLARLEKALAEEKAKLAVDQQKIDQRVDERLKSLRPIPRSDRKRDEAQSRPASTESFGSEVK